MGRAGNAQRSGMPGPGNTHLRASFTPSRRAPAMSRLALAACVRALHATATGRTKEQPNGNPDVACVREGNTLNEHVALLCRVISLSGAYFFIEQPSTSLFFETEAMKAAVHATSARQVRLNMCNFGSKTKKLSILVGTVEWLDLTAAFRFQALPGPGIAVMPLANIQHSKHTCATNSCEAVASSHKPLRLQGVQLLRQGQAGHELYQPAGQKGSDREAGKLAG